MASRACSTVTGSTVILVLTKKASASRTARKSNARDITIDGSTKLAALILHQLARAMMFT